jgi:2'-5' RNA ligase
MRCFVAVELPDSVRHRLAELRTHLAALDTLVRWTRDDQIHLTLKFIGEVPDARIAGLCEAVKRTSAAMSPFELEIRSAGCFPPHGPPRVIWAGVTGPPPELLAVHAAIEAACAELGYPPEGRAFKPHLTLARTREGRPVHAVRAALKELASFSAGTLPVNELVVFQSLLGPRGAAHIPLARAALRA